MSEPCTVTRPKRQSVLRAAVLALTACTADSTIVRVEADDGPAPSGSALGQAEDPILGGIAVTAPGKWLEVSAHDCTGVLIAPRWVLTAGHCGRTNTQVTLARHKRTDPGESIGVVANYPFLRNPQNPQQNCYQNPTSCSENWENAYDLSLLQLATPAQTVPARVAHGCASRYITTGAPLVIVGWGAEGPNGMQFNQELNEASLSIRQTRCDVPVNSPPFNYCIRPEAEFIAGTSTVDTCQGDSGGPAYVLTPLGPLVAGITSRSAIQNQPCGAAPGIYVRPDAVMTWINSVMAADGPLPEPNCAAAVPVRVPKPELAAFALVLGALGWFSLGRQRRAPNENKAGRG
jgi:hypothetical protein